MFCRYYVSNRREAEAAPRVDFDEAPTSRSEHVAVSELFDDVEDAKTPRAVEKVTMTGSTGAGRIDALTGECRRRNLAPSPRKRLRPVIPVVLFVSVYVEVGDVSEKRS